MKLTTITAFSVLILSPIAQAGNIPSGQQLQTMVEQKTQMINTQSLNHMLDNELDMVLIDIRTADEIKSMNRAINLEKSV